MVSALQHKHEPEYQLREKPRMADFAQGVVWAEEALGFEKGSFVRAYSENRSSASQIAIEGQSNLVGLLETLMDGGSEWKGTITKLHAVLKIQAGCGSGMKGTPAWFPDNVRVLSDTLTRLAPDLEMVRGIAIVRYRSNQGHFVELRRARGTS
jgi:hypothetical protein